MLCHVRTWLHNTPHISRLGVAFSGGQDSTALLHAFSLLREEFNFTLFAVHVHHGLNEGADDWALFCEQQCQRYNIPLHIEKISLNTQSGESIEAIARHARYAVFKRILKPNDYLCTAHHAADQIETFLIQWMRGAGMTGLCGIAPAKIWGQGMIARPLLTLSKKSIQSFCETHQLTSIEDTSNHDTRFTRNALRMHIVPKIKTLQPGLEKTALRTIKHLHQTQALLQHYVLKDLDACWNESAQSLELETVLKMPEITHLPIFRAFLAKCGLRMPNLRKLQDAWMQLTTANSEKNPEIEIDGMRVCRFAQALYVTQKHSHWAPTAWNLQTPLSLNSHFSLAAQKVIGKGIAHQKLLGRNVVVQARQGGERFQLSHEPFHRKVKKMLYERELPPWVREQYPLVYVDNTLVAIPGIGISKGWQAQTQEEGVEITCKIVTNATSKT